VTHSSEAHANEQKAIARQLSQREGRVFFFEKKNQKTFDTWRVLPVRRAPRDKSFLLLFFKNEVLACP
jgi:hypothetical protein